MIWPDESVTNVKRGTNHKLNKIKQTKTTDPSRREYETNKQSKTNRI